MTRTAWIVSVAFAGVSVCAPSMAWGQGTPAASAPKPSGWEVEVHGAYGRLNTGAGSGQLPSPGATFTMEGSTQHARYSPSWFFGDGAVIVNGHNSRNNLSGRIVPLDQVLTAANTTSSAGPSFGLTIARNLNDRWAIEGRADILPNGLTFTDAAVAQMQQSVASFVTALNGVGSNWSSDHAAGAVVTTTADRLVSIGGGVRLRFGHTGTVRPFVSMGAMWAQSASADASVVGDYRFTTLSLRPVHETDMLLIRSGSSSGIFGRFGAGVTADLTRRFGLRADAAVVIGAQTTRTGITTTPSRDLTIFGGTVASSASTTDNGIFFSTLPETPSSLSIALNDFETFRSSGLRYQFNLSAGIFVRF